MRKKNRQNSVARSFALNSDSFMSNLVIGTTKNLDARNNNIIDRKDEEIGVLDNDGYFLAKDGKKYKYEPTGDLIDKEGKKVPKEEIDGKLDGIDAGKLLEEVKGSRAGGSEFNSMQNTQHKFSNFYFNLFRSRKWKRDSSCF